MIDAADVAEGRAIAEAEMVDRIRVTRARRPGETGYSTPVFNEATGQYTEAAPVVVYEGKCRIQVRSDINANAVEAVTGEHEGMYRTATAQLPIEAGSGDIGSPAAIEPNHVAVILASPLDPSRVGLLMNLQAETKTKTHATHRRFRTREVLQ